MKILLKSFSTSESVFLPTKDRRCLSPAALHSYKERKGGLSPDWLSCMLLGEFCPNAIAVLTKNKSSVSSQCKFSHPANSALYPASSKSHQALADFGFFKGHFSSRLRKSMFFSLKSLQLQGRLPQTDLIWSFELSFLPSSVDFLVCTCVFMCFHSPRAVW